MEAFTSAAWVGGKFAPNVPPNDREDVEQVELSAFPVGFEVCGWWEGVGSW